MGWLAPLSPCRDTPTDLIEKVAARKREFNLCVAGRDHEFGWACLGGVRWVGPGLWEKLTPTF